MCSMPVKQAHHKYIDPKAGEWVDLHFGDHSFEGYVFLGIRAEDGAIRTLDNVRLPLLKKYVEEMHISPRRNYYITANTVTGGTRQKQHLFGLHNFVIDIDCHDESISSSDRKQRIETLIWYGKSCYWDDEEFPRPNSIVRTGRGVQFWWTIKPCAKATASYYEEIQKWLMAKFEKMLGEIPECTGLVVDRTASSNAVGYFRMPCTYNTAAKAYGTVEIIHKNQYNTHALMKIVENLNPPVVQRKTKKKELPAERAKTRAVPLGKKDLSFLRNYDYLCGTRIAKILQLRSIRNKEIGEEGRDKLCLVVYCELRKVYGHEEAMEYLRSFNDGFKEPFDEDRLQKKLSSAKDKCYRYSNEKIIEFLAITPEEQEMIGFYPAQPKNRKNRRSNASRDEVRRIRKEGRDAKIIELHKEGLSQVEIGRQLGINRKTAAAVIKKMEERVVETAEDQLSKKSALYVRLHHKGDIKEESTGEEVKGNTKDTTGKMEHMGKMLFMVPRLAKPVLKGSEGGQKTSEIGSGGCDPPGSD